MAGQISVVPEVLNLSLYAGDGLSFRILCKDKSGNGVDITGAVNAQIRLERLAVDPPVLEFTVNLVDAYQGIITLSLTGDQTKQLMAHPSTKNGKFTGVWDAQWTPSDAQPFTLCQGVVECVADVTRL